MRDMCDVIGEVPGRQTARQEKSLISAYTGSELDTSFLSQYCKYSAYC